LSERHSSPSSDRCEECIYSLLSGTRCGPIDANRHRHFDQRFMLMRSVCKAKRSPTFGALSASQSHSVSSVSVMTSLCVDLVFSSWPHSLQSSHSSFHFGAMFGHHCALIVLINGVAVFVLCANKIKLMSVSTEMWARLACMQPHHLVTSAQVWVYSLLACSAQFGTSSRRLQWSSRCQLGLWPTMVGRRWASHYRHVLSITSLAVLTRTDRHLHHRVASFYIIAISTYPVRWLF